MTSFLSFFLTMQRFIFSGTSESSAIKRLISVLGASAILIKVEKGGALSEFSILETYPLVKPVSLANRSRDIFLLIRNFLMFLTICFSSIVFCFCAEMINEHKGECSKGILKGNGGQ